MKKRKRKKRKKLTQDEREKKESLTGYPLLDGIIYITAFMVFIKYGAPYIKAFFE